MSSGLWKQIKILVVEDEPDLREILVSIFEDEGAQVFSAANGLEAIHILQKNCVDLVLSDVIMPEVDGIALLDFITHKCPTPRPSVFLVTGYSTLSAQEARQKGAVDLISKPFRIPELLETLESHLHHTAQIRKCL